MPVAVEVLENLAMFAGLACAERQQLADGALRRIYKPKMPVFLEGEPGDWVYFVLSGQMKLYKMAENGQEKNLLWLDSPEIFGESALFPPETYAVTAETITKSELLLVPAGKLAAMVKTSSILAWELLKIFNLRLRGSYRQVRNQALMDTYSRLVSRLFKLAHDHGCQTAAGVRIDLNLTHQELASFIGASRETVSRIMKELEKGGLVTTTGHYLLIPDLDRLRAQV